jgi:uncharacterized protein YbjT (DUF2867 family)
VVAGLRDFLATVKAFTDAVLGTRGGEDLASLALGVTSRWWPAWYCWDDVEVDQQDYGSPASMFERFTNIKELLLVNGTVGFYEVDQKTPTRSPGYKLAQHPIFIAARHRLDETHHEWEKWPVISPELGWYSICGGQRYKGDGILWGPDLRGGGFCEPDV